MLQIHLFHSFNSLTKKTAYHVPRTLQVLEIQQRTKFLPSWILHSNKQTSKAIICQMLLCAMEEIENKAGREGWMLCIIFKMALLINRNKRNKKASFVYIWRKCFLKRPNKGKGLNQEQHILGTAGRPVWLQQDKLRRQWKEKGNDVSKVFEVNYVES